ncbi:hypothetical protein [Flavobacterium sp. UW10123]|uniref:hypothetical protein n=1 Tax=Flavobacterium sp. UW10123 TaxID=3230800 RepID=UPI0025E58B80|nr:hypothetical protein [uncultured Flavobacterium sp.]
MNPYTNLTEALEGLICQGYSLSFTANRGFVNARNHKYKISYSEIQINHAYHFRDSDPDLDAVIYAISSKKHSIKGILIIGCLMVLDAPKK